MSRLLVFAAPLALALALVWPLSAAQKEKQPEPPPPPSHVLLRDELLREQQQLYDLQTQWLFQVLKLKRRLEKRGTESAKQEAAACTKLLDATRDLPALYDAAVGRLKTASLNHLPAARGVLKATGRLAVELQRVWDALQKDPQDPFAAQRTIGAGEAASGTALLAAADDLAQAADILDGITAADNAAAVFKTAADLVQRNGVPCVLAIKVYRQELQAAKDRKAPAAHLAFYEEKVLTPLSDLIDAKGKFSRAEPALAELKTAVDGKKQDDLAKLVPKAQEELRACVEPLREAGTYAIVVCRVQELAQRQRRLHDRLKKHHDDSVQKLLSDLEKSPD